MFKFVEQSKKLNVATPSMFSWDEDALFANVLLLETINYICDHVENTNHSEAILSDVMQRTYNAQLKFTNRI